MSFKKLNNGAKGSNHNDAFFKNLLTELPPIIPRKELPKYLGNLLSVGYMANLDSAGQGPDSRRIGGHVVYERDSFVTWLKARSS